MQRFFDKLDNSVRNEVLSLMELSVLQNSNKQEREDKTNKNNKQDNKRTQQDGGMSL